MLLNTYFPVWLTGDIFKNDKKSDEFMNTWEYMNTFLNLVNKRIDTFKWEGLPASCSERVIELALLFRGFVGFYRTEEGQYLALPASLGAELNVNGDFLDSYIYGVNGFYKHCKNYLSGINDSSVVREGIGLKEVSTLYNCVLGRENAMGFPFIFEILIKSKQLANRERTMDTLIETYKSPLIITCAEEQVKSIKEKFNSIRNNEPLIFEFNPLTSKDAKAEVVNYNINPELLKIVREDYDSIKNELNEKMGLNSNPDSDKKERLLVDEVNANNENIQSEIEKSLVWRRKFCEEVNDAFGLNISCSFRYSQKEREFETFTEEEEF